MKVRPSVQRCSPVSRLKYTFGLSDTTAMRDISECIMPLEIPDRMRAQLGMPSAAMTASCTDMSRHSSGVILHVPEPVQAMFV